MKNPKVNLIIDSYEELIEDLQLFYPKIHGNESTMLYRKLADFKVILVSKLSDIDWKLENDGVLKDES